MLSEIKILINNKEYTYNEALIAVENGEIDEEVFDAAYDGAMQADEVLTFYCEKTI